MRKTIPTILVIILAAFAVQVRQAQADERIRPAAVLLQEGYVPVSRNQTQILDIEAPPPAEAGSLNWPVKFADSKHTLGNNMVQFQNYGGQPYFHGGCDLRTISRAEVLSPITGRLEAGHYSYDTHADGSSTKYFKAWPASGETLYFEVAVISPSGFRFEFHHVDKNSLPPDILSILNKGGGEVKSGQKLGEVVMWPAMGIDGELYHHTHYNIIGPDGVEYNPEFFSLPLIDQKAPVIQGVYAVNDKGLGIPLKDGDTSPQVLPKEFIVAAFDQREANVYTQAPLYVELRIKNQTAWLWDFRARLLGPDNLFAPIFDVFKERLTTTSGKTLITEGNYQRNFFLYRLRVPENANGPVEIVVSDIAGNSSRFTLQ